MLIIKLIITLVSTKPKRYETSIFNGNLIFFISLSQAQFKQSRPLTKHTEISVSNGIWVEYIRSTKNEIIVETENKDHLNQILTTVDAGKLTVKYKPNTHIKTRSPNKVKIYSNYILHKVDVNSSGSLQISSPFDVVNFQAKVSSSGKFISDIINATYCKLVMSSSAKINQVINSDKLDIQASSSAQAKIKGKVSTVQVDMNSSAQIDLSQVRIDDLICNGSSSSKLLISTANTLDSDLSSSAKIYYKQKPKEIIRNHTTSSGKLIKN